MREFIPISVFTVYYTEFSNVVMNVINSIIVYIHFFDLNTVRWQDYTLSTTFQK